MYWSETNHICFLNPKKIQIRECFYHTVQYLHKQIGPERTQMQKLYPHNLNVFVEGDTFLSRLVN